MQMFTFPLVNWLISTYESFPSYFPFPVQLGREVTARLGGTRWMVGTWHPAKVNPPQMGTGLINQISPNSGDTVIKKTFPMIEEVFTMIYHLGGITTETVQLYSQGD